MSVAAQLFRLEQKLDAVARDNAVLMRDSAVLMRDNAVLTRDDAELRALLSARQFACVVESACMDFVWPGCRSAPYHMRSLKNLHAFLHSAMRGIDPTASGLCGDNAFVVFQSCAAEDQAAINARMADVVAAVPDCVVHVDTLKQHGNAIAHPRGVTAARVLSALHSAGIADLDESVRVTDSLRVWVENQKRK
jgi:hypothetical protein